MGNQAATPASDGDVARRLECPVCMDAFNTQDRLPKGLPCLHNVCLVCMRHLESTDTDSLRCPLCRKEHVVPRDLADLPNNPFIMELLDEENDKHNKDLQAAMKNTISESITKLQEYVSSIQIRFISTRRLNESRRITGNAARDDITRVFGSVIDELTIRQSELLNVVNTKRRELSEDLMVKAKASIDEANSYLIKGERILNQSVMGQDEVDKFQEAVSKLNDFTDVDESLSCIQATFDWTTSLDSVNGFANVLCSQQLIEVPNNEQHENSMRHTNLHLKRVIDQKENAILELKAEKAELNKQVSDLTKQLRDLQAANSK